MKMEQMKEEDRIMYFKYELHASIASRILSTPPNGNIGKEYVIQILLLQILPLQILLLKNSKFKILNFVIIVNMIVIKKIKKIKNLMMWRNTSTRDVINMVMTWHTK